MSDISVIKNNRQALYPALLTYLKNAASDFEIILSQRQTDLKMIADYIRHEKKKSLTSRLIFICTHNSRRSQLGQIWAQVAAFYYGLDQIETYSGGTEATAFNSRAVAALQRSGLNIVTDCPDSKNPQYQVSMSDQIPPMTCFSKIYHAPPNPIHDYCAVMTCAEADAACPMVLGCDLRVPIRYEDPKEADESDQETERYDQRSAQICREMLYLMSSV